MKISKLFHWLYAILMFLPIMVFIPNAFYYGFNEHAVAQDKTEQVPIYYESNEVNSVSDLQYNHIYRLSIPSNYRATTNNRFAVLKYYNVSASISGQSSITPLMTTPYFQNRPNVDTNGLFYVVSSSERYIFNGTNGYIVDFVFNQYESIDELITYISICPVQYLIEYQPLTTSMSITESMSYAWESVWHNELFSWTYGSFLIQPFLYITDLFNVPSTNTLVYCLSYWLDISIIWLVFDLIMYIPLLVHRWIDKGIIE